MDEIDRATELTERERLACIARARYPEKTGPALSRTHCGDCGFLIEAERLRVLPHATRCAECAHDAAIQDSADTRRGR